MVLNQENEKLESCLVTIIDTTNKKVVANIITDKNGAANCKLSFSTRYMIQTSIVGYKTLTTEISKSAWAIRKAVIHLEPSSQTLQAVNVTSRKPFLQQSQGKMIINVDAAITNSGTSVVEVLEKSPGVTVDKNGVISLQGKAGVLVLIDDKPTYLSGDDLSNLLTGMSSSQVDQIELMTSPPAKFDAGGNAGIINIKTKKTKQVGFNGVFTSTYGQGRYPKINNSLVLNYRNNRFNYFLTYGSNFAKNYTDLYALRHYFNPNGSLAATLDQPAYFKSNGFSNILKTGIDYAINESTVIGVIATGNSSPRKSVNEAQANWKNSNGNTDSSIYTAGSSNTEFKNFGLNINGKHGFTKKQDISFDLDFIKYELATSQTFNNNFQDTNGYTESSIGDIPSDIKIVSAKADYRLQSSKLSTIESGFKISGIQTDNIADFRYFNGTQWQVDLGKSNHFLYNEAIQAAYTSYEYRGTKVSFKTGLRYEQTHYDAHQLGNSARKDSAFSKSYEGLFPSAYLSYQADSSNSFSITVGRRIDRPAFQKLNPFVNIINKYTYSRGNPFLQPQYSWNIELSHQFKQLLTTTVSYSIIKDYFSQIFISEGTDILIYGQGNVGSMHNLGISLSTQLPITNWWTVSGQALYNYKMLEGYQQLNYASTVSQLNLSMNNQLRLNQQITAEISGVYTTKARNDLQELLLPTGQISIGVAKTILKKKGTLKLGIRDLLYTQAMEGNTDFPSADEYFILRRDSRVINLSFTYRFGKPLKSGRKSAGSATDEMQRVSG